MSESIHPVFLKRRDIPSVGDGEVSVLEMCLAAERVSGSGTIVGAQLIRGLWRIYPSTREARNTLLIQGLKLKNVMIKVSDDNPFTVRDFSGTTGLEKPTTKVFINDVPISVADAEIEHSLVALGCELRSDVKKQRARDNDGKLTRFLTGGRFVFITVPVTPLEKTVKVSIFSASVYHKEQKNEPRNVFCSKCLTAGHHMSQCENEIVCRECKQSGHKRGSPTCPAFDQGTSAASGASKDDTGLTGMTESAVSDNNGSNKERRASAAKSTDSGFVRPTARQSTLHSSFTPRSRSESKRRRSPDRDCEPLRFDKQAKPNAHGASPDTDKEQSREKD